MKYITKDKLIFLLPLTITLIACILFIPYQHALLFENARSGELLAFLPVTKEKTFKLKFTHSIHLSDVVENYRFTEQNEMQLYELEYEDFAIGMPENAGEGETFEQVNGKYFIKNMNRIFPFFDLRIGQVKANHTIIYNEQHYSLSAYMEPGSLVRIKADRINLLQQMEGVNILD